MFGGFMNLAPMAGDIGFEPILTESESAVLPLDESPMIEILAK